MGCGASSVAPPPEKALSLKDGQQRKAERRLTVTEADLSKFALNKPEAQSPYEDIRFSFQTEGCDHGSVEGVGSNAGIPKWVSFAAVSHAGYAYTGNKKTNQDRFLVTPNFLGSSEKALFGVFDGHGTVGHDASQYIIEHVAELAAGVLKSEDDNAAEPDRALLEKAMSHSFVEVDRMLNQVSPIDVNLSGATGVMMYMNGLDLCVGNAGDSRAVLARDLDGMLTATNLSNDNKPEDPEEKARIEASGGYCEPLFDEEDNEFVGPCRVWSRAHAGRMPGIAMSRSLGDKIATDCGVIPDPVVEFFKVDLETDQFIIIASDGVWEFISSEESVQLASLYSDPREMAEKLCAESLARWRREEDVVDDITCIVVKFHADKA